MNSGKLQTRVTAKDIARAAGVSQATVSLALRGSAEVSDDRIAQIRELANKMNYHPRAAAQLLRAKRAGQIGVLVASTDAIHAFSRGFTGPLLGSLVDECGQRNMRYMIEFHSHAEQISTLPYQIASGLVDGSVVIGDVGDPLRLLLSQEYPRYPWVSIEEPSRFCVLAESRLSVMDVVERLHRLGHRRMAYACGPQRYHTHHDGFMGWQEATQKLGLRIPERNQLIFDPGHEKGGIDNAHALVWARELLRAPDRPTAFICHDMVIARAVIHIAAECGFNVPRDLSVTSWGWHLTAQEQYPALTTVELDYREIIQRGVELLNQLIDGEVEEETRISVPSRYVEGATVGPAPKLP